MNKPEKCKIIMEINKLYRENLLEIFDKNYKKNHNNLYNRPDHFKEVDCNFIVNRFNIEDMEKFERFVEISKDLLEILKNLYGHGELWNLQIAKIKSGGYILPHVDGGLGFVFSHRIHIPLITNEKVIFTIKKEKFYLSSDYVYEINNLEEHSVVNNNSQNYDRIHLILDYVSNEYAYFMKNRKKITNCLYH